MQSVRASSRTVSSFRNLRLRQSEQAAAQDSRNQSSCALDNNSETCAGRGIEPRSPRAWQSDSSHRKLATRSLRPVHLRVVTSKLGQVDEPESPKLLSPTLRRPVTLPQLIPRTQMKLESAEPLQQPQSKKDTCLLAQTMLSLRSFSRQNSYTDTSPGCTSPSSLNSPASWAESLRMSESFSSKLPSPAAVCLDQNLDFDEDLLSPSASSNHSSTRPVQLEALSPSYKKKRSRGSILTNQIQILELGKEESIYDRYYWERSIQEEGDGGKVVICRRKSEAELAEFKYVMKIKSKMTLEEDNFQTRYRKMLERWLNIPPHPNIISLVEVLEDAGFYYVVMKRATGGDFFQSLLKDFPDGIIPAASVKRLVREILQGVSHLHKSGMLHRDIKPDNLVLEEYFDSETDEWANRVVLIDFDHAEVEFGKGSAEQQPLLGTLRFNAPETFIGNSSRQSDLYSVGVILYLLMSGSMPYNDLIFDDLQSVKKDCKSQADDVYLRMRKSKVDWSAECWTEQSACRDFCQCLLSFSASDRPTSADVALEFPWLTE